MLEELIIMMNSYTMKSISNYIVIKFYLLLKLNVLILQKEGFHLNYYKSKIEQKLKKACN